MKKKRDGGIAKLGLARRRLYTRPDCVMSKYNQPTDCAAAVLKIAGRDLSQVGSYSPSVFIAPSLT